MIRPNAHPTYRQLCARPPDEARRGNHIVDAYFTGRDGERCRWPRGTDCWAAWHAGRDHAEEPFG